jgi:hypothetical protein
MTYDEYAGALEQEKNRLIDEHKRNNPEMFELIQTILKFEYFCEKSFSVEIEISEEGTGGKLK